jgi:nucleoid-associated protein YgaU
VDTCCNATIKAAESIGPIKGRLRKVRRGLSHKVVIDKEQTVKLAIPAIAVSLLIAAGCQQQQASKPMTDSATLDVNSSPMPVAYASPAPIQTATPDPALASAAPMGSSTASNSNNYTIQKGDTLWKIASQHYGDGKKWHEIADANPGLSPSSLRIGATITLP